MTEAAGVGTAPTQRYIPPEPDDRTLDAEHSAALSSDRSVNTPNRHLRTTGTELSETGRDD